MLDYVVKIVEEKRLCVLMDFLSPLFICSECDYRAEQLVCSKFWEEQWFGLWRLLWQLC